MTVLEFDKLSLTIDGAPVLAEVSMRAPHGQVTGLVGRSGSGKSMAALAAMRLLPKGACVSGAVRLN
ncbi:MAG: ATP-binding cassette domain-containing protein, partial [Hyphococcus sp.]